MRAGDVNQTVLQRKPLADTQGAGAFAFWAPYTDPNTVPLEMMTVTLNMRAGRPQLALHSLSASAQRLLLSVVDGLTATLTWTQAWQEPSWVLHLSYAISSSLYCKYCTVQSFL